MFHSTSSRSFRLVNYLAHFKIHQQLPLSPRESRQLLNLLTTSFKQQLDREYDKLDVDENVRPRSNRSRVAEQSLRKQRHSAPRSHAQHTADKHIQSLLTDPIFKRRDIAASASSGLPRDPMEVFDDAYARGFMKIEYATACLKAKKAIILRSSYLTVAEGMKGSKSAMKVLKWLSANKMITAETFLGNPLFTALLVEFMMVESLQDVLWLWFEADLKARTEIAGNDTRSTGELAEVLLFNMVKTETASVSSNLDPGIALLARAKTLLDRSAHPTYSILTRSGNMLTYKTTVQSREYQAPSRRSFECLVALLPHFTHRTQLLLANLDLHHPDQPRVFSAITLLKRVDWLLGESSATALHEVQRIGSTKAIIALALDTARYFLEKDKFTDMRWVMDFLQTRYPERLGLHDKAQAIFEQAKAEAGSLELLHSLQLA